LLVECIRLTAETERDAEQKKATQAKLDADSAAAQARVIKRSMDTIAFNAASAPAIVQSSSSSSSSSSVENKDEKTENTEHRQPKKLKTTTQILSKYMEDLSVERKKAEEAREKAAEETKILKEQQQKDTAEQLRILGEIGSEQRRTNDLFFQFINMRK